jgi:4-nitrophenyl phosphatase
MIGGRTGGGLKTLVFDLDGVVYVDRAAVPGAGDMLTALDRAGNQILFATNNSSRAVGTVVENIRKRTGYHAEPEAVITSGLAAADLLRDGGDRCFVFGSEELEQTLAAEGIEVTPNHMLATAVVVGLDRGLTYRRLTDAVLAVRRGARLIATNDDATYPAEEGQYPGCGAIVAAVERATGVEATVCGKPHSPIQRLIEQRIEHQEVWMVGDRVETDLELAERAGWRKILVLSGVTEPDAVAVSALRPHHTINSIAELGELLSAETPGVEG